MLFKICCQKSGVFRLLKNAGIKALIDPIFSTGVVMLLPVLCEIMEENNILELNSKRGSPDPIGQPRIDALHLSLLGFPSLKL